MFFSFARRNISVRLACAVLFFEGSILFGVDAAVEIFFSILDISVRFACVVFIKMCFSCHCLD